MLTTNENNKTAAHIMMQVTPNGYVTIRLDGQPVLRISQSGRVYLAPLSDVQIQGLAAKGIEFKGVSLEIADQ